MSLIGGLLAATLLFLLYAVLDTVVYEIRRAYYERVQLPRYLRERAERRQIAPPR